MINYVKFPKDDLQELVGWGDPEGYEIVLNQLDGNSRWSLEYRLVFKHGDKFWETSYRTGATEQQDESPWEYDSAEIECWQVEPFTVAKTDYKSVNI